MQEPGTESENLGAAPFIGPLNGYFRSVADRAEQGFVARYATDAAGRVNPSMANAIHREISRRYAQSMALDVSEPIMYSILRFPVVLLGTTALMTGLGIEKHPLSAIKRGALVSGLATGLDVVRPFFRFRAAMYGSAQTARVMEQLRQQLPAQEALPPGWAGTVRTSPQGPFTVTAGR